MKRKLLISLVALICASALITACSSEEEYGLEDYNIEKSVEESNKKQNIDYSKILEDSQYYIRHSDGTCEKLYFGESTYSKDKKTSKASNKRITWYGSDYDKIPTFYDGDELIFYSSSQVPEVLYYERFRDYGISFGLCQMETDKNGRITISTNIDDQTTYPGSEGDKLLLLKNKDIVIDAIGGVDVTANNLTDIGSFDIDLDDKTNFNKLFTFTVYDGTIKHELDIAYNIKILASMDVRKSADFDFDDGNIIKINIPQEFNTGFYNINGNGMFRYIKGSSYDEYGTDFNIENIYSEEAESVAASVEEMENSENGMVTPEDSENVNINDATTATFTVTNPGTININVTFTDKLGSKNPDISGVSGTIVSPLSNSKFYMANDGVNISREFEASEKGTYTITFANLKGLIPSVSTSTKGGN